MSRVTFEFRSRMPPKNENLLFAALGIDINTGRQEQQAVINLVREIYNPMIYDFVHLQGRTDWNSMFRGGNTPEIKLRFTSRHAELPAVVRAHVPDPTELSNRMWDVLRYYRLLDPSWRDYDPTYPTFHASQAVGATAYPTHHAGYNPPPPSPAPLPARLNGRPMRAAAKAASAAIAKDATDSSSDNAHRPRPKGKSKSENPRKARAKSKTKTPPIIAPAPAPVHPAAPAPVPAPAPADIPPLPSISPTIPVIEPSDPLLVRYPSVSSLKSLPPAPGPLPFPPPGRFLPPPIIPRPARPAVTGTDPKIAPLINPPENDRSISRRSVARYVPGHGDVLAAMAAPPQPRIVPGVLENYTKNANNKRSTDEQDPQPQKKLRTAHLSEGKAEWTTFTNLSDSSSNNSERSMDGDGDIRMRDGYKPHNYNVEDKTIGPETKAWGAKVRQYLSVFSRQTPEEEQANTLDVEMKDAGQISEKGEDEDENETTYGSGDEFGVEFGLLPEAEEEEDTEEQVEVE
ncbi:hypothetical protein PENCOP_c009G03988 [Penicillium coprophilum]|uniref:Uncharacterized protein n=1 Tax=Penicillium coprophilum TaxID=36646 RepID=A0A1V6UHG6_9EURO|nr:hypothetical protein PENCOP_c009G03988 [Penicillium coprophilum]